MGWKLLIPMSVRIAESLFKTKGQGPIRKRIVTAMIQGALGQPEMLPKDTPRPSDQEIGAFIDGTVAAMNEAGGVPPVDGMPVTILMVQGKVTRVQ